jgi:hypothetical protein
MEGERRGKVAGKKVAGKKNSAAIGGGVLWAGKLPAGFLGGGAGKVPRPGGALEKTRLSPDRRGRP